MTFAAGYWLWGLVPWGGVALFLLIGRLKREPVPFLDLWKGPAGRPQKQSLLEPPPLALVAALVGMLLAIVGAARPKIGPAIRGEALTIIVDRGAGMSARVGDQWLFLAIAVNAHEAIRDSFGRALVRLSSVPGEDGLRTDVYDWLGLVRRMPPTAIDTGAQLKQAVERALRAGKGPVIVISGEPLDAQVERMVRIGPETGVRNAGITYIAARESPVGQLMVKVSANAGGVVPVRAFGDGKQLAEMRVQIGGGEKTAFIEVPDLSRVKMLWAELAALDDLPADNRAYLVRQRSWPILEVRSAVSAEVRRMVEAYSALRRSGEGSKRVSIVGGDAQLPADAPGAIDATAVAGGARVTGAMIVREHSVTRSMTPVQLADAEVAQAPDEPGWATVISIGGRACVAVRESPNRQVWIGLRSSAWATSPQFVILWTNIFDWLGEGAEAFASEPVRQLGSEWRRVVTQEVEPGPEMGMWPGIYARDDGALKALNAGAVRLPTGATGQWRDQLRRVAAETLAESGAEIGGYLLLLAIGAILISALTWRRPLPGRRFSEVMEGAREGK